MESSNNYEETPKFKSLEPLNQVTNEVTLNRHLFLWNVKVLKPKNKPNSSDKVFAMETIPFLSSVIFFIVWGILSEEKPWFEYTNQFYYIT